MGKKDRRQIFRLAIEFGDEQSMRDFIAVHLGLDVGTRALDSLDNSNASQEVHNFIARKVG